MPAIPLVVAGVSAFSGAWQAHRAKKASTSAASIQSEAAKQAGARSDLATSSSLDFFNRNQAAGRQLAQPYLDAGAQATGSLFDLANGWSPPPTFSAPDANNFTADPSYQFRVNQGRVAYENSAAAKGSLSSANTAKGLIDYGQEAGSQEYSAAYGRSLSSYNASLQAYLAGMQGHQNQFSNLLNVAQMGYGASNSLQGQNLQYSQLFGNTQMEGASQFGNWLTQGANAKASGIVGASNAGNSAISSGSNALMQALYMQYLKSQDADRGGQLTGSRVPVQYGFGALGSGTNT